MKNPFAAGILKTHWPLLAVLAVFLAAKLPHLLSYHLQEWDGAVFLFMGKYAYSLGASGLWEVIRPLGLPLSVGWASLLWTAASYAKVAEVIVFISSAGVISLTYLAGLRLFGRKVAFLSAAILASSPLFFLNSSYIMTEVPSVLFLLFSLLLFASSRYFSAGVAAALAVLFKFPNGLLLLVFALAAFLQAAASAQLHRRFRQAAVSLAKAAGAFMAAMLPFFTFNFFFYRRFTGSFVDALLRPFILAGWHQFNPAKAVSSKIASYTYYATSALKQHVFLGMVVVATIMFVKRKWHLHPSRRLFGCFLLVYAAYFSIIPNKDQRFLLLFLPAACIFASAAFFDLLSYRSRAAAIVRVSLVGLLLVSSFLALSVDYRLLAWWPPSESGFVQELYGSIQRLGITGQVMTSDPIFSVYGENLFLPYYDSSRGIPEELKPSWDVSGRPFEAVVYSPQNLYCPWGDFACYSGRDKLHERMLSSYSLEFNGTYYGTSSYYVFVNRTALRK